MQQRLARTRDKTQWPRQDPMASQEMPAGIDDDDVFSALLTPSVMKTPWNLNPPWRKARRNQMGLNFFHLAQKELKIKREIELYRNKITFLLHTSICALKCSAPRQIYINQ